MACARGRGAWETEWLRIGNAVREVSRLQRARLFVFSDGIAVGFVATERGPGCREKDFRRLLGEFLLRSYGNGVLRETVRTALINASQGEGMADLGG